MIGMILNLPVINMVGIYLHNLPVINMVSNY